MTIDGRPVIDGQQRVEKLVKAQRMRGPDQEGIFISEDRSCVMGNNRLAIVDPNARLKLPFRDADEKHVLSFNGEIYNYRELAKELEAKGCKFKTKTDTEVLFRGLQEFGADFIGRLDGMFAWAFYNGQIKSLTLARDILGERHLFYIVTENELIFANEAHALLQALPEKSKLDFDPVAAVCAIRYYSAPSGRTLISQIKRLKGGELLELRQNSQPVVKQAQKLDLAPSLDFFASSPSEEIVLDRFSELMFESVERRLPRDVPFFVTLSGGIDSTLIASFAAETGKSVNTIFCDTRNEISGRGDELEEYEASKYTAKKIGADHIYVKMQVDDVIRRLKQIIERSQDGMIDSGIISFELLADEIRSRGCKVLLVSDGPDEFAGGYPVDIRAAKQVQRIADYPTLTSLAKIASNSFFARRAMRRLQLGDWITYREDGLKDRSYTPHHEATSSDYLRRLFSYSITSASEQFYSNLTSKYSEFVPFLDPSQRRALAYADSSIPDFICLRLDRGTMARSVETRLPFLSKKVAEFLISLPASLRFRDGYGKYILRKLVERRVGKEIAWRSKHGFGPSVLNINGVREEFQMIDYIFDSGMLGQAVPKLRVGPESIGTNFKKVIWPLYVVGNSWNSVSNYR